ncbi:unnamed protein product [Rotaria socialis]|uniref:Acetyl-CoA carboxylase n=2 Tax=Rotaria socialis TaxID=392032 RepID=A0A820JVG8_9BILA|nr:unnamed protein product [Rotaria socialis]CAF4331901.1 unnamed protein product [Rotaria socialis]CAF4446892.1 unnamed protein product [Rotaria socialis]
MASVREAQMSPSKIIPNGNHHHISKVKFGLDNSHHIDDTHGSLDKILESSAPSNNYSSPSKHSTLNGSTHAKILSNDEYQSIAKQCTRKMSGLSIASNGFRSPNMTTPKELCDLLSGSRVINKILIANNGIAAVKCMRSIRRWSYEMYRDEHAVKFVAMVTPEDMKANAEYIRYADHYVNVQGGPSHMNYSNCELILDIAKRFSVEAVWAGWGHASENPKLPELLHRYGIIFIGPPEQAMWALGDKIASTIIAQSADIPTFPWSGSHLKLEWDGESNENIRVPMDIYEKACIKDATKGVEIATRIGFPVMIKASEGGGGKGIRKATNREDFENLFRQVQAEVPGSPIFLMKYADSCRHLEVQILADQSGQAISLFGRDCSIQRRHQKIIEEAPAIIAPPEILEQMEKSAVRLTKMVGYVSAGTIEYLYNPNDQTYFFLELNPRLQVEHPCTEMVTDINLPACQLQIAMGICLHRIKDIRLLYGEDPFDTTEIDFAHPRIKPKPHGHAIAARITSENPNEGFKPSSGTVEELTFRSRHNVWGYFSISSSGGLHEFADSQFGHVFSHGETREDARENLAVALKELSIRGDFHSTVEILIRLLETDDFINNTVQTSWLDGLIAQHFQTDKPDIMLAIVCGAIHVADEIFRNNFQNFQSSLERGQILPMSTLTISRQIELIYEYIKYKLHVTKCGPSSFFVVMNDSYVELEAHRMKDGGILINLDGSSYLTFMKEEVDNYRIIVNNKTCIFQKENDPSILRAPSAGKLLHYTVEDGGAIEAGQIYAEIEVMKMVTELRCPSKGYLLNIIKESNNSEHTLQWNKRPGAVLDASCVLARIILDDSQQVQQSQLYDGKFTFQLFDQSKSTKLNQIFQIIKGSLENILAGYTYPEPYFRERLKSNVETLFSILRDPSLPLLEVEDILSNISERIPKEVDKEIKKIMKNYHSNLTSVLVQFPSQAIASIIDSYASKLEHRNDRDTFFTTVQSLLHLVQCYRNGIKGYMKAVITDLIRHYLNIETLFQHGQYDKCLTQLRDKHKIDMSKVVEIVFSHANYNAKNALVILLIDLLFERDPTLTDELTALLTELALLTHATNSKVVLKSRQVLIAFQQPPYELRHNQMESIFLSAIDMYGHKLCQENIQKLISSETSILDVLHSFYFHSNVQVRQAALEVYVRRSYVSYDLNSIQHRFLSDGTCAVQFALHLPHNHPNRLFQHENMIRVGSISDELVNMNEIDSNLFQRMGISAAFDSWERAKSAFDELLTPFSPIDSDELSSFTDNKSNRAHSRQSSFDSSSMRIQNNKIDEAINLIYVFIKDDINLQQNLKLEDVFLDFVQSKREVCAAKNIRRITFSLGAKRQFPVYYTYRKRLDFQEDKIYRNLEPALAYQLEVYRLRSFDLEFVPTSNHKTHIYLGKGKVHNKQHNAIDYRFFARSIIRHSDFVTKEASYEYLENEAERTLLEAMDELEIAFSHPLANKTDCNHVFLCFVPTVCIEPTKLAESVRTMVLRYGLRLWKLRILQAELKMTIRITPDSERIPFRVFLTYESGYHLDISLYREETNQATGQTIFRTYTLGKTGPLDGRALHDPYLTKDHLQYKRFTAQSNNTTYVYDFPEMFRQALLLLWKQYFERNNLKAHIVLKDVFNYEELILDMSNQTMISSIFCSMKTSQHQTDQSNEHLKQCGLLTRTRSPAENDCGIVAWRIRMKTPECPNGRAIIVIANDITYKIGSFGIEEDLLFQRASELARLERIPRIYISANSGARIGLAEELKFLYRIAWNDPTDIDKGIQYLYLTPDDYSRVSHMNCVRTETIKLDNGEVRHKIIDIIGKENSLGVENLRGSGMIAGETSYAYNLIPTISLVTCRAVGIGAYLVRLGSRVIQVENSHIILTGAAALNKVLGREVYNSNNQLGGIQIMYNNGVTHDVVKDDFDGCLLVLRWLSYMPETMLHLPPVLSELNDPIDRQIDFVPTPAAYDPRHMIQGGQFTSVQQITNDTDELPVTTYQSGFFDRDSFIEIMKGWAKTVVCGRARLGGIPMGVIAVETRTIELEQPADPANFDSDARTIQQAGQVWFPDSAFKTAQAINDFKRENLPLMIFANWRGFSGGMKDMYDQIIKFGAYIVDALRTYDHPVFIYIPPYGELRGGAWVVVDPTINLRYMEMYADRMSRGGVLEAEGTVEIKYRTKDLIRTIHRVDDICQELIKSISSCTTNTTKEDLERQLAEREKNLLPIYQQAATMFCDLHDTPGRMLEKGVIQDILNWRTSREFFYWRLKRRLEEDNAIKTILTANPSINYHGAVNYLQQWFSEDKQDNNFQCAQDRLVVQWFEQFKSSPVTNDRIKNLEKQYALEDIRRILQTHPDILSDIVQPSNDEQSMK